MENEHISNLFQGLRARLQEHIVNRAQLAKIIFEETKIPLPEASIQLKKGVLSLKLSPLQKTELAIKKEAILARIASETKLKVIEIR
jgi:hypothetical protein